MSYKGKYTIKKKDKYAGDAKKVIYRSLWERKFMVYCDRNEKIVEWGSEEFFIPYRSPLDGKIHRYFPDFYVKVKTPRGMKKWIVEVKPKAQTRPPKTPKRKTSRYINEVRNYAINDAKWKNATEYCKDRDMEFIIITEDELGV